MFSFSKPQPQPQAAEPTQEQPAAQPTAQVTTPDPVVNPAPAPAAPVNYTGLLPAPQRFNVQISNEIVPEPPAAAVVPEPTPAPEPQPEPEPEVVPAAAVKSNDDGVLGAFLALIALLAFNGAKFILTHTFVLVVTLLTYVDEDIKSKYIKA